MTKLEFKEWIKSFGKNPGEYTDEELYEIGATHKEKLQQSDKSWKELVEVLGVNKSPDAFRCWIKSNSKRVDEMSSATSEDVDALKFRQLYVEKQKNRDIMNSYRRSMRDEARIEVFKDSIVETVSTLNALPKIEAKPHTNQIGTEAVLMLSDLHIGVMCDNFYNKYNVEVAAKRLSKLAADTILYCAQMGVNVLNVCNLGDMVQGLIHINARLEQQMDTVSQVMTAAELLSQFLNQLTASGMTINYRSCTDNHSRTVANLGEHIEKDNFYRIIDWFLQERLKDTSINFINDNIDSGIGKFNIFGNNVVFVHGHQDSIDKMMQNMVGATGEIIDYALMGHFHCEKMKSYQGFKVFVNGSIVGTEQYALSRRLFSRPSQTLLVFTAGSKNVVNISIDLGVC